MTTGKDVARRMTGKPPGGLREVSSLEAVIDMLRKDIRDEAEAVRNYPQQARAINRFVAQWHVRTEADGIARGRLIQLVTALDRIAREEKEHLRQFMETLSLISPDDWHKAEDEVVEITGMR